MSLDPSVPCPCIGRLVSDHRLSKALSMFTTMMTGREIYPASSAVAFCPGSKGSMREKTPKLCPRFYHLGVCTFASLFSIPGFPRHIRRLSGSWEENVFIPLRQVICYS
ncbi:hypothetical protein AcW2_006650 [Taiwanofungus camphoratus]|nr:hypothetical protein AcW2_006650 [Antrodia cinnamomea]